MLDNGVARDNIRGWGGVAKMVGTVVQDALKTADEGRVVLTGFIQGVLGGTRITGTGQGAGEQGGLHLAGLLSQSDHSKVST